MGWKTIGGFPKELPKYISIVAPHTSMMDFIVGVLVRKVQGETINFVGKKELFKFPLGIYMRWMGGEPVDRSGGKNKVDAIVDIFNSKERFKINIAPEGTRTKVDRFRTGFYYIAKKAGIPIVMIAFDYKAKEVRFEKPFYPTDDVEADMTMIEHHFSGIQGKIPEYSFESKR